MVVIAIKGFTDLKENKYRRVGDEWETEVQRAENLFSKGLVEISEREKVDIEVPTKEIIKRGRKKKEEVEDDTPAD